MSEDGRPRQRPLGGVGLQVPAPGTPRDEVLVCVARHAKPEQADDRHRFLGQADPPLASAGIAEAEQLAERLQGFAFAAIYASDLRRSVATANVIAERIGSQVRTEPRLREIDTGLWEGLTREEAKEFYPMEYAIREADLVGYQFPGGESFREVERRVAAALADIGREGHTRILIVGHLGVNRVLLCRLKGLPLRELFSVRQEYCDFEMVWCGERWYEGESR